MGFAYVINVINARNYEFITVSKDVGETDFRVKIFCELVGLTELSVGCVCVFVCQHVNDNVNFFFKLRLKKSPNLRLLILCQGRPLPVNSQKIESIYSSASVYANLSHSMKA